MPSGSRRKITNIVIDTNVFVSAALSPSGISAKVARLVASTAEMQVFYSNAILAEYKRVLAYERLGIAKETQSNITNSLQKFGILIEPPTSTMPMPDETDRMFYDAAKASGAILITGNKRHFPVDSPSMRILTPSEFLLDKEGLISAINIQTQ